MMKKLLMGQCSKITMKRRLHKEISGLDVDINSLRYKISIIQYAWHENHTDQIFSDDRDSTSNYKRSLEKRGKKFRKGISKLSIRMDKAEAELDVVKERLANISRATISQISAGIKMADAHQQ